MITATVDYKIPRKPMLTPDKKRDVIQAILLMIALFIILGIAGKSDNDSKPQVETLWGSIK